MNAEDEKRKEVLKSRCERQEALWSDEGLWLIARLEAEAAELDMIDNLLSRRAALDDLQTRYDKINKTLMVAGHAEVAEQRVVALENCLRKCRDALKDLHPKSTTDLRENCSYCSTIARADELLAAKEAER